MKTKLFSIVNFVAVLAGESVSLPHGININDGTPVIPDELKRRTNGSFAISADDTNITVTNNSGGPENIDVLCEHWHSIERQLGVTDNGKSSLSIQPWESIATSDDLFTPKVRWAPGTPADKMVGNSWSGEFYEAYDESQRLLGLGFPAVEIEIDNTYATGVAVYDPGGPDTFTVTDACIVGLRPEDVASDYDMRFIQVNAAKRSRQVVVNWADHARWTLPAFVGGNGLVFMSTSEITEAMVMKGTNQTFWGEGKVSTWVASALAKPVFKAEDGGGFKALFTDSGSNDDFKLGFEEKPPGSGGPMLAPVLDLNGCFMRVINFGKFAVSNSIMDSAGGAFLQFRANRPDSSFNYLQPLLAGSTIDIDGKNSPGSRAAQPGRGIIVLVGPIVHDASGEWGFTYLCDTTGGDVDITLPSAAIGTGESIHAKNVAGAGAVNFTPAAGEAVDVAALAAGLSASFESDGSLLPGSSGLWVSI